MLTVTEQNELISGDQTGNIFHWTFLPAARIHQLETSHHTSNQHIQTQTNGCILM
jgi:hypothetical protein